MLVLGPDQIDLWFVFFDDMRDVSLLDTYRGLLTTEERMREQSFYFAEDRHRYLVTRASVRTILSRYSETSPERWHFCANAYGRPAIANDDPVIRRISFNLSHTRGLIVLGITRDNALGVDTEHIRARPAPIHAADSFFSPDEVTSLRALPEDMQQLRFFQYWTLKEAYIKACGRGLSIPLDQFSFHFSQDRHLGLSFHPALNDQPTRWCFWQFQATTDYLATICVKRSGPVKQQILMKKFVPFGDEQVVEYPLLRESI
jgi:4'-phosphopantetheinyl transferase